MVGYDPNINNLSQTEQVIVSATTSIVTRCMIQPFDVIKIRFQVQYEPISKKSKTSKYKGVIQTVSTIIKEEGSLALWKGHLTGQILSISYNSAQFFWFDLTTRLAFKYWPDFYQKDKGKYLIHFLCGGLAASLTVITNQPIDTVRTRLISQGEPRAYKGILDAFQMIYTKEGIKGFYRGTLPCILSSMPETAFKFGIYEFLNKLWTQIFEHVRKEDHRKEIKSIKKTEVGHIQSIINGSISGVFSKAIVYPFDLVKKRLQIQGFESARKSFGKVVKFDGLWNCLILTIKNEGFLGVYKGFYPSMLKAAVSSGLTFFFYEKFSNVIRNK